MIRINLLESERAAKGKAGGGGAAAAGAASASAVAPYFPLIATTLLSLGVCGFLLWSINGKIAAKEEEIAAAKVTVASLEKEKARKEELERKRKSVQDQVNLIERLKIEQAGPVRMLDEISKALPDFVWLTTLTQSGPTLKISGESANNNAIADYLSNLQRAGDGCDSAQPALRVNCWFPDANIDNFAEGANTGTGNSLVLFSFTAAFQNPEVAQRDAAAKSPAAPAAAKK